MTTRRKAPTRRKIRRMTKTGSRRRNNIVTVPWAPSHMGELRQAKPKRAGIITPEMAEPNRDQPGYRSQEVSLADARTSGI